MHSQTYFHAVNLIETVSQDPVENIIQQEIIHKVEIQNKVLEVSQESALKPLFIRRTSTAAPLSVTLDTGIFGRPIINVWVWSNAHAEFRICLSNDNVTFYPRGTTSVNNSNQLIVFSDNAFRYVKVETNAANNNTIVIGAIR